MKARKAFLWIGVAALLLLSLYFAVRAAFPCPHREIVSSLNVDASLVYSVAKTESGFDEKAVSHAGAVGLMQLLPSTAKFICDREHIVYEEARLTDGAYNLKLGCLYLSYLLAKFGATQTALAAYNAGEGTVRDWLSDPSCSDDGVHLRRIPYPETERYVKKIGKIRKIYEFFY